MGRARNSAQPPCLSKREINAAQKGDSFAIRGELEKEAGMRSTKGLRLFHAEIRVRPPLPQIGNRGLSPFTFQIGNRGLSPFTLLRRPTSGFAIRLVRCLPTIWSRWLQNHPSSRGHPTHTCRIIRNDPDIAE